MFLRPLEYHANRFHDEQEKAWLAYKAGLDLVLPCSRRSGKSELICQLMIEDVEDRGLPCLYVAKTRDQARDIVWPKFEQALKGYPDWKLYESSLEVYHKPSKAQVRIKGVDKDADNLTGSGYRIIACDEYALWRKPDVVGRVLAPMLGDYNGQFIFASTKRGKNHFYKLHQKALAATDKYYVGEWTMFENTFMTDEGRAKVLSEYEGGAENLLYRQEVLNEYVVFEGQVFALDEERYLERVWDNAIVDHSLRWRCVDHGYSPDPTACLWMAYNPRKGYYQVYNEYKQHALLISQHAQVINKVDARPFTGSYSDVDPQVVAEYENVGLKLSNAIKGDKQARLLAVVNALQSGRLKIADHCVKLRDEMQQYVWDQDHNDDLVDALSMLWASAMARPEEMFHVEQSEDIYHSRDQLDGHGQSFDS